METIQERVETWCLVLILYLCNKTDKNRQLAWSNVAMKLGQINAEEGFTLKLFKQPVKQEYCAIIPNKKQPQANFFDKKN